MGANDSPTTTHSIVSDYFDWRLNNQTTMNNRAFTIVRRFARDCEGLYGDQQPAFEFRCSVSPIDQQTLNNLKTIIHELAKEMFCNQTITWSRIIAFISYAALSTERIIQQQADSTSRNLIISSMIDWTAESIDAECQTWLESQNYWSGFLKTHDKTPQRRNSISRYAGLLGTIGMLTLGALYMRRT